jgi:CO dehydrogenase maturation factor
LTARHLLCSGAPIYCQTRILNEKLKESETILVRITLAEKMKILICGKGGSGKSTIASLLAKNLNLEGYRVLVVDSDESNYGLNAQLGLKEPVELLEHLGGKQGIKNKMTPNSSKGPKPPVFNEQWSIEDIPGECVSKAGNLNLVQIGKVKHSQEGCACPMGVLAKDFISHLKLASKEVVIVDAEAGVEHLGRGLAVSVDVILAVLDPSYESIRLSEKIVAMAKEAGKPVFFILNKTDSESREKMLMQLGKDRVIGSVPFSKPVQDNGLSGKALDPKVIDFGEITRFIDKAQKR